MIDELLQACRGSVKSDLERYEQLILQNKVSPTIIPSMTAEANRLRALLDAIDAQPASSERVAHDPDRWADAAMPPDIERRLAPWLTNGAALHPLTINLVVRFARALSAKLAAAETKYGYSDGWTSPDWMDECRANLMEHVLKGDPRDVAAYCAFLWHHGGCTTPMHPIESPRPDAPTGQIKEPVPGILPVKESDHG